MRIWDYIHDNEKTKERFGETKQMLLAIFVFLAIPLLIYGIISWNPVIGFDEGGDPVRLGIWVTLGLYWGGAYFSYKSWQRKKQLNRLLDGILDEYESDRMFRTAKEKRELLKKENARYEHWYEEGEKRLKWFN